MWNRAVQNIIDYIEDNITQQISLVNIAREIGYSPYYCSSQFHIITGKTIKSYVAARRLTLATLELRDTSERIVDIALKYGYSSQQSFARAFVKAYMCTPMAYRKNNKPIPISIKKEVIYPQNYIGDENFMSIKQAIETVRFIPAHKYIYIKDENAQSYFEFWEHNDCDKITGIVESMANIAEPILGIHVGGWLNENGIKAYTYGACVPKDYKGEIPEGFEVKEYPDSYYMVFSHPAFNFVEECEPVTKAVETLAWSTKPEDKGFMSNDEIHQDYQVFLPETIGYEIYIPVKK